MKQFDIITIFPRIFDSYFSESILKRALKKKLIKINVVDLRKYAKGRHRQVDNRPYGGGPGMILNKKMGEAAIWFHPIFASNYRREMRIKKILTLVLFLLYRRTTQFSILSFASMFSRTSQQPSSLIVHASAKCPSRLFVTIAFA